MITHEIIGDDMQAVVLTLASGDEVRGSRTASSPPVAVIAKT